ncbi:MAG: glycosyltransferase family 39 protein [Verrucomicrobiota bacterium]|nr:glycosyltransferase family 39 protein [Verrucomicrobiota bacterium]
MSAPRALILVSLAWAAIYLPALGTLEIKGEEGRRILPAVTMLESGNYIVPQVGSDPYFSKPPLVNWLVAASFKLFGERNEWTARLPSVLCVLAVALAFVTVARSSLGPNGSFAAALIWLANFGMLEKGRLIEIEALYVSLGGLAFICWMSGWQQRRSPWFTWMVPWIILGFGLLAKGPLHLVFFYAVVLAILYRAGELRLLWKIPHLVGVLVMLAIFAAWAVPCLWLMQHAHVTQTWARQFSGRLSGEDFKLASWLLNIPRALGYFLPWTLLLPFARPRKLSDRRELAIVKGLLLGIGVSFVVVSLLPGTLPRYTMPLLVPTIWLTALLLARDAFELPRFLRSKRLPQIVAIFFAVAVAIYAIGVVPHLKKREKIRTIAMQINAALPAAEPLYAVDPDYQPFLFYVRDPIIYVAAPSALPRSARYILVQPEREEELHAARGVDHVAPILRLKDYRNKEVVLLRAIEP